MEIVNTRIIGSCSDFLRGLQDQLELTTIELSDLCGSSPEETPFSLGCFESFLGYTPGEVVCLTASGEIDMDIMAKDYYTIDCDLAYMEGRQCVVRGLELMLGWERE